MRIALLIACFPILVAAQDKKPRPNDVIQLNEKAGKGIRVGRITEVDDTGVRIILRGRSTATRIEFSEMLPYSVYRIKANQIDADDAEAHLKLGEYCQANNLFSFAIREYRQAMALDDELKDSAKKKIFAARSADARTKYEEAKRLAQNKKWKEASKLLTTIILRYSDTAYYEDAKKEVEKITLAIEAENDKKKNVIANKKKAAEAKKAKAKENQENALFGKCVDGYSAAKKAWGEGLDWEGKGNLTKADRAWKRVEERLLVTRRTLALLLKSNDVTILKKSKDLHKEATQLLVTAYYRLGAMWAIQLNFPQGRLYLNKALKLPHDTAMEHLINETLLTMNQLQMRKRAAGKGY